MVVHFNPTQLFRSIDKIISRTTFLRKPAHIEVEHPNVVCSTCSGPVIGIRYKCTFRPNFNLCETCIGLEPVAHQMKKIYAHDSQCSECLVYPITGPKFTCSVRINYHLCNSCEDTRPQPFPTAKTYIPGEAPQTPLPPTLLPPTPLPPTPLPSTPTRKASHVRKPSPKAPHPPKPARKHQEAVVVEVEDKKVEVNEVEAEVKEVEVEVKEEVKEVKEEVNEKVVEYVFKGLASKQSKFIKVFNFSKEFTVAAMRLGTSLIYFAAKAIIR